MAQLARNIPTILFERSSVEKGVEEFSSQPFDLRLDAPVMQHISKLINSEDALTLRIINMLGEVFGQQPNSKSFTNAQTILASLINMGLVD